MRISFYTLIFATCLYSASVVQPIDAVVIRPAPRITVPKPAPRPAPKPVPKPPTPAPPPVYRPPTTPPPPYTPPSTGTNPGSGSGGSIGSGKGGSSGGSSGGSTGGTSGSTVPKKGVPYTPAPQPGYRGGTGNYRPGPGFGFHPGNSVFFPFAVGAGAGLGFGAYAYGTHGNRASRGQPTIYPTPVAGAAYAQHDNFFFIQGGYNYDPNNTNTPTISSKFYALDLTLGWDTSNPQWYPLADGPALMFHSADFSIDSLSFVLVGGFDSITAAIPGSGTSQSQTQVKVFSVKDNSWPSSAPNSLDVKGQHFSVVTDPDSGNFLVPGAKDSGYLNPPQVLPTAKTIWPVQSLTNGSANQEPILSSFNPGVSFTVNTTAVIPNSLSSSLTDYAASWIEYRKSIMYFGSTLPNSDPIFTGMYAEYYPASDKWSNVTTTGDIPPRVHAPCVAASMDGSTLVMYGGRIPGNNNTDAPEASDIYVLNLDSMAWTKGTSEPTTANSGSKRLYSACTLADTQFIVFGGNPDTTVWSGHGLAIYDLQTKMWSDSYVPTEKYKTENGPQSAGAGLSLSASKELLLVGIFTVMISLWM